MWEHMLEESPATPMETFPLQICSSVLLNPNGLTASVSSVLVKAHTACKMRDGVKRQVLLRVRRRVYSGLAFLILHVLLCKENCRTMWV